MQESEPLQRFYPVAVTGAGKFAISWRNSSPYNRLRNKKDYILKLWDIETGECIRTMEGHTGEVMTVAGTDDGRFAISAGGDYVKKDFTLKLWDLETSKCIRRMEGHTENIYSAVVTKDSKFAISGGADKTIKLWDLETGECIRTMKGHTRSIQTLAVSGDGKFALSASSDKPSSSGILKLAGVSALWKGILALSRLWLGQETECSLPQEDLLL